MAQYCKMVESLFLYSIRCVCLSGFGIGVQFGVFNLSRFIYFAFEWEIYFGKQSCESYDNFRKTNFLELILYSRHSIEIKGALFVRKSHLFFFSKGGLNKHDKKSIGSRFHFSFNLFLLDLTFFV